MSLLRRYWGYPLVVIVAVLAINRVDPAIILCVAVASLAYFVFQVPVWCTAETRGGQLCRNNSRGLLFGCHLRQHKWQVFKAAVLPHGLRGLRRSYWASPTQRVATLSGSGSMLAAIVALVALVLDRG